MMGQDVAWLAIQRALNKVLCRATAARYHGVASARLHPRNPARGTQQLVLPLAPLAQLGRAYGVAAQVQEYLGAPAEALAGKVARAVRDARAVGKQLPAGWLARVISEQLDLQHVWIAGSAELFLEHPHRKAHLVGEIALDHGRGIAARLV